MTRRARQRRLRVIGVVSSVLLLALGLALVTSIAGGAPRAAANLNGAVPSVYVVGGQSGGAVDALNLDTVRSDPGSISPVQHGTSTRPIIAVAITPDATKAVLLEIDVGDGEIVDWTIQVLNVATGVLSGPAPVVGSNAVGVAADPANPGVAYVVDRQGQVWSIGLTSNPPAIKLVAKDAEASVGVTNTIALAPNGLTAFVGGFFPTSSEALDDFVDTVPLQAGGLPPSQWTQPALARTGINLGGAFTSLGGVTDLAVAPQGNALYGVDVGTMFKLPLPLPGTGTTFSRSVTASGATVQPIAVTASPNGDVVYAGGFAQAAPAVAAVGTQSTGGGSVSALPLGGLGGGALRDAAMSISASPDQQTLLATVGGGGFSANAALFPIGLGSGTAMAAPTQPITLTSTVGPTPGPEAVAVTPDQAPVARFNTVTAVQLGHSISFDASPSTVAYGSVTNFAWTFGDGQTASGPNPDVTHVYSTPGAKHVTVTETDSAGTSIPPAPGTPSAGNPGGFTVDGPGQTAYRQASIFAQISGTINVTTTPPPSTTPTTTTTQTTTSTTPTTTPGTSTTPTTTPTSQARVPTLVLNPGLGPPGTIVTVTGSGFQPNTPVTVSWSTSTGSVVITANGLGDLPPSPLLILTPDVLGPRFATASSAPPASAPFLVVPSTSEPGGDAGLLFRSEGP